MLLGATQFKTSLPLVFNNTNSHVVESVKEDDSGYNLSLHNTSTSAVLGLAVAVIGENGVCDLHTLRLLPVVAIEAWYAGKRVDISRRQS